MVKAQWRAPAGMNRTARGQVEAGLVGMSRRFDAEGGREAVGRMLEAPEPPTALILCYSEMAAGVLDELAERGREPGRDMPVIGWGTGEVYSLSLAGTKWAGFEPDRIEILTRLVPSGSS